MLMLCVCVCAKINGCPKAPIYRLSGRCKLGLARHTHTYFLTCRAMAVPFSTLAVNFLRQPFITIALFAKPKASQMSSEEEEGIARLARQFERQNGGGVSF